MPNAPVNVNPDPPPPPPNKVRVIRFIVQTPIVSNIISNIILTLYKLSKVQITEYWKVLYVLRS